MKSIIIGIVLLLLTGCASTNQQMYYETAKSISKDITMAQTACFLVVGEIAKNADNATKTGAIALVDKCKNTPIKLDPPKKNLLDF